MKKIKAKIMGILALVLVFIGASAELVSAKTLGDGMSIMGYNAGYVLIIVGIVAALIVAMTKIAPAKSKPMVYGIAAVLIIGGLALAFVNVEETATGDTTASGCQDFDLSVSTLTSGDGWITGTVWDEDTKTLTIPLTVSDSSDGNLTGHLSGVNCTIDPLAALGDTADTMATLHYRSTNYDLKYNGEKVFNEQGGYYNVEFTDAGGEDNYEGSQDIQLSSTGWVKYQIQFNNGTAGNWVTELSQIGDSLSWEVEFFTDCGIVETWDVVAIVVSYTA